MAAPTNDVTINIANDHFFSFLQGDFTVLKWDPPTRLLPTVPEGKIVGSFMLVDGDAIFFSVDFEGTLKNRIPGLGR